MLMKLLIFLFESDGSDAEMGMGDSSGGVTDSDDDYEVSEEEEYIDFEGGEDLAYFMLLHNIDVVINLINYA
jgi:hypothetical protein